MDLLDYTSLLEIYSLLAFAYFSFDSYNKTISVKIFQSSKRLDRCVSKINEKIERSEKIVTFLIKNVRIIESKDGSVKGLTKTLNHEVNKFVTLQQNFEQRKEEIDAKISAWQDVEGFTKISLFSAIFCICSLYVAGLLSSAANPDAIYIIFLCLSFALISLSATFAVKDTRETQSDNMVRHMNILYSCVAILVISIIIYLSYSPDLDRLPVIRNISIISIIIAPASQYIFYFIRFLFVHNKSEKLMNKLVENYEDDIVSSENTLKIFSNMANNIVSDLEEKYS